jgi:hypothetical protein
MILLFILIFILFIIFIIFSKKEGFINKTNKTNKTNEPTIQIKGMVIGHTPQFTVFGSGITTACSNRIIRVDIGASTAFDSFSTNPSDKFAREPQVIEINTDLSTKKSTVKILKLSNS